MRVLEASDTRCDHPPEVANLSLFDVLFPNATCGKERLWGEVADGSDGLRGSWGLFRPSVTSSNLMKQVLVTQSVPWCLEDQGSPSWAEISPDHRADTTALWLCDLQPQASILPGFEQADLKH